MLDLGYQYADSHSMATLCYVLVHLDVVFDSQEVLWVQQPPGKETLFLYAIDQYHHCA